MRAGCATSVQQYVGVRSAANNAVHAAGQGRIPDRVSTHPHSNKRASCALRTPLLQLTELQNVARTGLHWVDSSCRRGPVECSGLMVRQARTVLPVHACVFLHVRFFCFS